MSMVAKDESLKEVRTFKQEDINHMKIAYMPPLTDIGPDKIWRSCDDVGQLVIVSFLVCILQFSFCYIRDVIFKNVHQPCSIRRKFWRVLVDRNIIFVIVHPPEAGEMIRRLHTAETGTRITRFSQRDLERGAICYRH
jgi:hypothetical protein